MTALLLPLLGAALATEPADAPVVDETYEPPVEEAQADPAVPEAQAGAPIQHAQSDEPRVVETVWITLEDDDPTRRIAALEKTVRAAGGTIVRSSADRDSSWGSSASLTAVVPVQDWPEVREALRMGPDDDYSSEAVARADQQGSGLPHVVVSFELSEPMPLEPNFLVGAMGGLSIPADDTGLGLAQVVGLRAMDPDREGSFEVLYAPSNAAFTDSPDPWMLQLTGGGSMYSEYLGGGERVLLNPYIGGRLGYAYRGESWFVLQADFGLEILHAGHVIWDIYARPTGAFRKGAVGLSVETGTGIVIPF